MSNQNYGKKASVKWASDDDAGDLLASILNETETDAELEQQRIEAEMKAREQEAQRLKDAEEQHRRAEAEARISAEMDRLQQVEVRRTQKLEALKIEDLKESGLWQPPEEPAAPEPAAQADSLHAVQAMHAPTPEFATAGVQTPAAQAAPQAAEKKSNTTAIAILGVVIALVVVSAVAVAMLTTGSYKVDNTTYAKAVYTPKDNQILLVEKGFAPLPKPEPVVEESAPAAAPARRTTTTRRNTAPAAKAAPTKAKSTKAPKKKIELDLDFDPFKSGF